MNPQNQTNDKKVTHSWASNSWINVQFSKSWSPILILKSEINSISLNWSANSKISSRSLFHVSIKYRPIDITCNPLCFLAMTYRHQHVYAQGIESVGIFLLWKIIIRRRRKSKRVVCDVNWTVFLWNIPKIYCSSFNYCPSVFIRNSYSLIVFDEYKLWAIFLTITFFRTRVLIRARVLKWIVQTITTTVI